MIDYERMKRVGPKLKAALTRAKNKQDTKARYFAVKDACKAAVREWNSIGAWPDNWSHWQRALDDAYFSYIHTNAMACPKDMPARLEEL